MSTCGALSDLPDSRLGWKIGGRARACWRRQAASKSIRSPRSGRPLGSRDVNIPQLPTALAAFLSQLRRVSDHRSAFDLTNCPPLPLLLSPQLCDPPASSSCWTAVVSSSQTQQGLYRLRPPRCIRSVVSSCSVSERNSWLAAALARKTSRMWWMSWSSSRNSRRSSHSTCASAADEQCVH